MGVGQGSAFSPILSTLYLSLFLYILEKCLKNLNLKISILFFVDDGLLISQGKSFQLFNTRLFSTYNITSKPLSRFSLLVEHLKTEVFYFSRSHSVFNSLLLNLSAIKGPSLIPKDTWRYLGFIFDRKLYFC